MASACPRPSSFFFHYLTVGSSGAEAGPKADGCRRSVRKNMAVLNVLAQRPVSFVMLCGIQHQTTSTSSTSTRQQSMKLYTILETSLVPCTSSFDKPLLALDIPGVKEIQADPRLGNKILPTNQTSSL